MVTVQYFPDSLRLRIITSGGVTSGNYIVTVKGNGANGTPVHIRNLNLVVKNPVGITSYEIPTEYKLYQNYPNPFNPVTKINYEIPVSNYVSLKIFGIDGKEIVSIVNERQVAGKYSYEFDGRNLSSGIYFYKLVTNDFTDLKRMVLVK